MAYHLDGELDPWFWVELDAPERFVEQAIAAADGNASDSFVTVTEINRMPTAMVASFQAGKAIRMLDHRLAGHALASQALAIRRPGADIAMTIWPVPHYELDQLLLDLLAAPENGVDRRRLHDWLVEQRRTYNRRRPPHSLRERWLRRLACEAIPLDQAFPRAQAAIYG